MEKTSVVPAAYRPRQFSELSEPKDRPFNFRWFVVGQLSASGYPVTAKQYKFLHKCRTGLIVNLTLNSPEPRSRCTIFSGESHLSNWHVTGRGVRKAAAKFQVASLPTTDGVAPNADELERWNTMLDRVHDFLAHAERAVADPQKRPTVHVHCFGGGGRTSAFLATYLIRHGGLSPDDALDMVTKAGGVIRMTNHMQQFVADYLQPQQPPRLRPSSVRHPPSALQPSSSTEAATVGATGDHLGKPDVPFASAATSRGSAATTSTKIVAGSGGGAAELRTTKASFGKHEEGQKALEHSSANGARMTSSGKNDECDPGMQENRIHA